MSSNSKKSDKTYSEAYSDYIGKKYFIIIVGVIFTFIMFLVSASVGAVNIPVYDVAHTLFVGGVIRILTYFYSLFDSGIGMLVPVINYLKSLGGTSLYDAIIWNIRIPQALTAVVAGAGLAIAGVTMQSVLRNPLASPFTLGLSNAAAFGAAVGILIFDSGKTGSSIADAVVINNPYITTFSAFLFALLTTAIIIIISKMRTASPETMVLAGVAISSIFNAGLMAIQYFVDDTKLASIVFWQFGDVSRAGWDELFLITVIVVVCFIYIYLKRWDFNAIDAGEETAKGLGVDVEKIRIVGMVAASLISAIVVSFLGIIGFVGLVCPHMMRRFVGDDHRFLIPASLVCGSLLLLVSDTVARVMIAPHVLPVAVLTAFLGGPMFLYLIIRGKGTK